MVDECGLTNGFPFTPHHPPLFFFTPFPFTPYYFSPYYLLLPSLLLLLLAFDVHFLSFCIPIS